MPEILDVVVHGVRQVTVAHQGDALAHPPYTGLSTTGVPSSPSARSKSLRDRASRKSGTGIPAARSTARSTSLFSQAWIEAAELRTRTPFASAIVAISPPRV